MTIIFNFNKLKNKAVSKYSFVFQFLLIAKE